MPVKYAMSPGVVTDAAVGAAEVEKGGLELDIIDALAGMAWPDMSEYFASADPLASPSPDPLDGMGGSSIFRVPLAIDKKL